MIAELEIDPRHDWWLEEKAAARKLNPLRGYCQRVYFTRTSCKRRGGKHKGKVRRRSTREVELLRILGSGRCMAVKDLRTPGLDALAEEVFASHVLPPNVNPAQLFLDYFRQM